MCICLIAAKQPSTVTNGLAHAQPRYWWSWIWTTLRSSLWLLIQQPVVATQVWRVEWKLWALFVCVWMAKNVICTSLLANESVCRLFVVVLYWLLALDALRNLVAINFKLAIFGNFHVNFFHFSMTVEAERWRGSKRMALDNAVVADTRYSDYAMDVAINRVVHLHAAAHLTCCCCCLSIYLLLSFRLHTSWRGGSINMSVCMYLFTILATNMSVWMCVYACVFTRTFS